MNKYSLYEILTDKRLIKVANYLEEIFGEFSCDKDNNIERFIKEKAILYEKENLSRTIIYLNETGELLGFYSIAHRDFVLDDNVSNKIRKQVKSYLKQANSDKSGSGFLIGQIGKNSNKNIDTSIISDGFLIQEAFNHALCLNTKTTIRTIYLECCDNDKLISYYQQFGFKIYVNSKNNKIKNRDLLIMYLPFKALFKNRKTVF